MSDIFTITMLLIALFVFIIGLIMPSLSRKGLFFGVRIPREKRSQESLKNFSKAYTINHIILSIILVIICAGLHFNRQTELAWTLFIIGMTCFMMVNYILIHYRVRKKKAEEKWMENTVETSVMDVQLKPDEGLASLWWFVIPIVIISLMVIISLSKMDSLPQQIPIHWNARGEVDRIAQKSISSVLSLPIIQSFMTLLSIFIYIAIRISKIQLSATDPEESKIRVIKFRRGWSAFTIGNSILLTFMFVIPQMQILQYPISNQLIWISFGLTFCVILGWTLYLSIHLGQGGSRVKVSNSKNDDKRMNRDDDKFWKWGSVYYNPDDPSLMIEKRFGIGWTMNFGNKWSLVVLGMLILLIAAAIIFSPQ